MLTAKELYLELQKLEKTGRNLEDINIMVESSQNDEFFYLMKGMELKEDSNNVKFYFDDDREDF